MAGRLSLAVVTSLAIPCRAAPALQVPTTAKAGIVNESPDGQPAAALQTGSSDLVTIKNVAGNVVACSLEDSYVLSSKTYFDCVGSFTTLSTASTQISRPAHITTIALLGSTIKMLSIEYTDDTSKTVTTLVPGAPMSMSSASHPPSAETPRTSPQSPSSMTRTHSVESVARVRRSRETLRLQMW